MQKGPKSAHPCSLEPADKYPGRDRARPLTSRAARRGRRCRAQAVTRSSSVDGSYPTRVCGDLTGEVMIVGFTVAHGSVSNINDLYRVPEIVTRGRFPDGGESDSTWRTQEARHVGSDTIAPGFWCATGSRFGKEDQRRASGSPAFSTRGYLRWGNAHRGGQDRRCRTSDHPGLGVALQRPRS